MEVVEAIDVPSVDRVIVHVRESHSHHGCALMGTLFQARLNYEAVVDGGLR